MKKIFTILILVLLGNFAFAKSSSVTLRSSLGKVTKQELTKTFKSKGLEAVVKDLYVASMALGKKYVKNKKNKNGQKITDKNGRRALVMIVEAVDHINKTMEPGDVHYYGPAKLYKNFRVDMNLAIEKAKIPVESKSLLRSALPNSY